MEGLSQSAWSALVYFAAKKTTKQTMPCPILCTIFLSTPVNYKLIICFPPFLPTEKSLHASFLSIINYHILSLFIMQAMNLSFWPRQAGRCGFPMVHGTSNQISGSYSFMIIYSLPPHHKSLLSRTAALHSPKEQN